MAETTADVRRDIEVTRERMSSTLTQLEQKMNLTQVVKDHPWPALAMAVGAGILLSGSGADTKAAGATLVATRGASSKVAPALDDIVARLMQGVGDAFQQRVDTWLDEIKTAIGAPPSHGGNGQWQQQQGRQQLADVSYGATGSTSTDALDSGLPRAD